MIVGNIVGNSQILLWGILGFDCREYCGEFLDLLVGNVVGNFSDLKQLHRKQIKSKYKYLYNWFNSATTTTTSA